MEGVEDLHVSGSVKLRGPVRFGRISVSGSVKIEGTA